MNWAEQEVKKNWAEPSDDEESLPPPEEVVEGDIKTVVEYKYNEKNQKVKVHKFMTFKNLLIIELLVMPDRM